MADYYAVVYKKDNPWPIRHVCLVHDIEKTKEAFFKWYYTNYYELSNDEVEFCNNMIEAREIEKRLKEEADKIPDKEIQEAIKREIEELDN